MRSLKPLDDCNGSHHALALLEDEGAEGVYGEGRAELSTKQEEGELNLSRMIYRRKSSVAVHHALYQASFALRHCVLYQASLVVSHALLGLFCLNQGSFAAPDHVVAQRRAISVREPLRFEG